MTCHRVRAVVLVGSRESDVPDRQIHNCVRHVAALGLLSDTPARVTLSTRKVKVRTPDPAHLLVPSGWTFKETRRGNILHNNSTTGRVDGAEADVATAEPGQNGQVNGLILFCFLKEKIRHEDLGAPSGSAPFKQ